MGVWKKGIWLLTGLVGIVLLIYIGKTNVLNLEEDQTEAAVVELEIWYPWSEQNALYKNAFLESVSEYNEQHTEVQLVPYGMEMELYREKLPADIASNDVPDIYYCFAGSYLEKIVQSGRVLALDEYLTDQRIKSNEKMQGLQFENKLYGVGFAETECVFLVNDRLFKKYGIAIPESVEELMEACRKFLEYGITPLACSDNLDVGFRMYLEALCLGSAGMDDCMEILTGQAKVSTGFLEGVELFRQLNDMGAFVPQDAEQEKYDAEEEFCMSRIPMYYTKNSFVGTILQKNHPLYGKISAISFPGIDETVLMGGVTDCFVVNAAANHPEESVLALQELMFSFAKKLHESGSGISIWEEVEEIPEAFQSEEKGNLVYQEMRELGTQAELRMPFWEIIVPRESMEEYLEISKELYEKPG